MDVEVERADRERIAVVRSSMAKVDQLLDEPADAMAARGIAGATASPLLSVELETVGRGLIALGDHLARPPACGSNWGAGGGGDRQHVSPMPG